MTDETDVEEDLTPLVDDPTALDNLGTWVGGSTVRVRIPQTETTVVGTVHGGDGHRTRVIVESDEGRRRTSILTPGQNIVEVVER